MITSNINAISTRYETKRCVFNEIAPSEFRTINPIKHTVLLPLF